MVHRYIYDGRMWGNFIFGFSFQKKCWQFDFDSFGTGSSRIQSFRTNDVFQISPAIPRRLAAVKTIPSWTVAESDQSTWLESVFFFLPHVHPHWRTLIQTLNQVCPPWTGLKHIFQQSSKKEKIFIFILLSDWYPVGLSLQSMIRIEIFFVYLVPRDVEKAI